MNRRKYSRLRGRNVSARHQWSGQRCVLCRLNREPAGEGAYTSLELEALHALAALHADADPTALAVLTLLTMLRARDTVIGYLHDELAPSGARKLAAAP